MKKKTLWLAMFVLTPALYAQTDAPSFTREQVLDVFARFNPAVLDRARQDKEYEDILSFFLENYRREITPASQTELLAAVRNFDTSIRLDKLKKLYKEQWTYAKMAGQPVDVARRDFAEGVSEEMAHIWAVTVQIRNYQLEQAKTQLTELRKDAANPQRATQEQALQKEIEILNAEIRALKENAGPYITMAVESYVDTMDKDLMETVFSVQRASAEQSAQQARATTNLQLKSKHKKPVAE